jgi:DNA-binding response OmpR family regulator
MSSRWILIVDDEPTIHRAVADYLTECGYETSTTEGKKLWPFCLSASLTEVVEQYRL